MSEVGVVSFRLTWRHDTLVVDRGRDSFWRELFRSMGAAVFSSGAWTCSVTEQEMELLDAFLKSEYGADSWIEIRPEWIQFQVFRVSVMNMGEIFFSAYRSSRTYFPMGMKYDMNVSVASEKVT